MKHIFLALFCVIQTTVSFACTTFILKSENELVFGRNLDWVSDDGIIIVNQRDQTKTSVVFPPDKPITWTSKYGSVTFNQFGKDLPFGGMNEKGLVIEIMVAPAEYSPTDNRKAVNELQWVQYQLDNAATIEEVIANDNVIRLRMVSQQLHFLVADALGNAAVIEFKDGKMQIFKGDDLPIQVLENDVYSKSLKRYNKNEATRFTRATNMVNSYSQNNDKNIIDYSFSILKEVALSAQWSIVYDIHNKKIYFKTKSNQNIKEIDMNSINFSCQQTTLCYDLKEENTGNINYKFSVLTKSLNTQKLQVAFSSNRIELPKNVKEIFYNYYTASNCKKD